MCGVGGVLSLSCLGLFFFNLAFFSLFKNLFWIFCFFLYFFVSNVLSCSLYSYCFSKILFLCLSNCYFEKNCYGKAV